MFRILEMDPSDDLIRRRQDEIRRGIPTILLHPRIPFRCCRRIADRMYWFLGSLDSELSSALLRWQV